MSLSSSIFLRACRCLPVDRTPVWLMRQAGRYMAEYRAVRKSHSLLEICKTPALAAEVTATAAEKLGVDAAIIFADLLLPLEPMGLPFHFASGEGPVIEKPLRSLADVAQLRDDCASELDYVCESVRLVRKHFAEKLPIIGFCGAPFTLASYIIEGGSSRHYVHTKRIMYTRPEAWDGLMNKLVRVLSEHAVAQIAAGADAFQIFDSWVGCLSVDDYRRYALPYTTRMISAVKDAGVPVIYFGTDTATLLPSMQETGADVLGLDWRVPLNTAWREMGYRCGVQGNLDPVVLFADPANITERATTILQQAGNRPGHIFNLGHGILPETPVGNVQTLVSEVHEISARMLASAR